MHTLILIVTLVTAVYSAPTSEYIDPTYQQQPELAICRGCIVAAQITKRVKT